MQRYIIVDKYRDGEISWEMKPHDHGDIAFYAEALADIEAAVHEWQDIAGQWEDKCQKLTEQIAALETAVKEKDKVIEAFEAMKEGVTERISDLEAAVKEKDEHIAELKSCLNLFGDDPCWCELLIEKCAEITNLEKQTAALTEDRDKWQSKAHYQNQDNLRLTAERASITDLLNIYLRENGVTEIEHPTMPDIKGGIDRLAESAVHYKLHKEHLTAENKRLKEREANLREYRFVDATPNGDLPVRILSAYIEGIFTTDNTVGIPPENPLCKLMNETQEKINIIIRKAIDALK